MLSGDMRRPELHPLSHLTDAPAARCYDCGCEKARPDWSSRDGTCTLHAENARKRAHPAHAGSGKCWGLQPETPPSLHQNDGIRRGLPTPAAPLLLIGRWPVKACSRGGASSNESSVDTQVVKLGEIEMRQQSERRRPQRYKQCARDLTEDMPWLRWAGSTRWSRSRRCWSCCGRASCPARCWRPHGAACPPQSWAPTRLCSPVGPPSASAAASLD